MTQALVIGGGLAGSAVALLLARAGRQVTLIEKESAAHDKVCGEFLSTETVSYLTALGIDLAGLGAVPITTVSFQKQTRSLPFAAQSLSRRVLDEALLELAVAAGATIPRGRSAQGLERYGAGWRVRLGETTIEADSVFLATGKHDLRGYKRPPGKQNDLVAFKMHWQLTDDQQQALASRVELFLFPGGYGGLERVEDGKANLCFLIQRRVLDRCGFWPDALSHVCAASPEMAERLAGAIPLWDKPLAITAIPYGYVCRADDGLWRLGDQAAVIPSFSGDGMAIALHSAFLAAKTYLAGGSAAQYQQCLRDDVAGQVRLATAISRALVNPLTRDICIAASRLAPRALDRIASATRIPVAKRLSS